LSFSNLDDARRFVQGFGGQLLDFTSAQTEIKEMMAFKMGIHSQKASSFLLIFFE